MSTLISKLGLVSLCLCLLFSCKESYLDIGPQGSLDEISLATPEGVHASLVGTYAMLDGWNNDRDQFNPAWAVAGSNWIWGSVASDDAYKGANPAEMPAIGEIELFQWEADHPYLDLKFRALYEGVARANATLRLIAATSDFTESEREALTGEARFLRAHYHFEAYKFWGRIPYYQESDTDFRKSNDADPITAIRADLNAAIEGMPASQEAAGRANKWTAQAYLGKVLLYDQQFAAARTELDAVVTSGPYALADCFHEIFTAAGENGSEMIFSIQASVNDGTDEGENGNYPEALTYPGGASPFECCGFHQPSQNLVNAYRVDANGLPLLDTYDDQNVSAIEPVDPRLDWTVGREGVPYLNWGTHQLSWILNPAWAGPFSPKKLVHSQGQESQVGWSGKQLGPVNIPILRFADVMLMLAECEVEAGSLERARELVNDIRTRAATCAQGPDGADVPMADPGIDWAKYRVAIYDAPWNDPETARKAVRMERRLELALEGHRLFDLRRWGTAETVLNAYVLSEQNRRAYLGTALPVQAKHTWFPIPAVQIQLSEVEGIPRLQQNPGW